MQSVKNTNLDKFLKYMELEKNDSVYSIENYKDDIVELLVYC